MRLFIGINLPKKQRAQIHRVARALREEDLPVRWIEPDNFHVTLKFLGDVRPEQVDQIKEIVQRVAASTRSFSTELTGFGAFPTVRRPRIIWLGVTANPELRCLKQDLEWSLSDMGFETETRAFHPHVTLGRASTTRGAGVFRSLDTTLASLEFAAELRIHTVDLIRSQLSREGARYGVVASARLATS